MTDQEWCVHRLFDPWCTTDDPERTNLTPFAGFERVPESKPVDCASGLRASAFQRLIAVPYRFFAGSSPAPNNAGIASF